jgi:thiamine-monophosphate kinase
VSLSEADLLRRVQALVPGFAPTELVLGIGDDCAIYRPRPGEDLLCTTDFLIEGVHFGRETHPSDAVGHKALARGLSDIAAMGGEPRFCLLSLALPKWVDDEWVESFYGGLLALAATHGVSLAGGDLARAKHLTCDVVVCGAVPAGKALRRDGARAGDGIYVSGELGASALGLTTQRGGAWKRHLRPQPRLALGRFLRQRLPTTAAMDLSDGLSLDLARLCQASGVAADVTMPPRYRGATIEQALHGGEDYELLFTVRGRSEPPSEFEGLRLTRIGEIRKGPPGEIMLNGRPLPSHGYDHFRKRR